MGKRAFHVGLFLAGIFLLMPMAHAQSIALYLTLFGSNRLVREKAAAQTFPLLSQWLDLDSDYWRDLSPEEVFSATQTPNYSLLLVSDAMPIMAEFAIRGSIGLCLGEVNRPSDAFSLALYATKNPGKCLRRVLKNSDVIGFHLENGVDDKDGGTTFNLVENDSQQTLGALNKSKTGKNTVVKFCQGQFAAACKEAQELRARK